MNPSNKLSALLALGSLFLLAASIRDICKLLQDLID